MTEPPPQNSIDIQIDESYAAGVDVTDLARAVEATLQLENVHGASLNIAITDEETVRALNSQYRNIDAPTDVLSFASHDNTASSPGDLVLPPELAAEMASFLGDIVIAYPYAERQASRYGNSVAAELRLLVVHGTLHLLGYDHDTPANEAAMWAVQETVLAQFGNRGLSERMYDA